MIGIMLGIDKTLILSFLAMIGAVLFGIIIAILGELLD